jgi:hypothetical protein
MTNTMVHTNSMLSVSLLLVALGAFAVPPATAQIRFEEVSEAAGIRYTGQSYGSAWADYDGDGCLDLFVSNHVVAPSLYRNRCDGTFEDVADETILRFDQVKGESGTPSIGDVHGGAWGDYDNDGDPDLLVAMGGAGGTRKVSSSTTNRLYRNDGGRFIDWASEAGLDDPGGRGRTPMWQDLDGDGRLDALLNQRDPLSLDAVFRKQSDNGFVACPPTQDGRTLKPQDGQTLKDWRGAFATRVRMFGRDEPIFLFFGSGIAPRRVWRHVGPCQFEVLNLNRLVGGVDNGEGRQDAVVGDFNGDLRPDLFFPTRVTTPEAISADGDLKVRLSVPANKTIVLDVSSPGPMTLEIGPRGLWRPNTIRLGEEGVKQAGLKIPLRPSDPGVVGVFELTEDFKGLAIGYLPEKAVWRITARPKKNMARLYLLFEGEQTIKIESSSLKLNESSGLQDVLLLEDGDSFSDRSKAFGLSRARTSCRSVAAGDFDNDMDLDIYMVCGEKLRNLPNRLYENRRRFFDVTKSSGAGGSTQGVGQHVSIADYDNDGFLDLFVANGEGPGFLEGGPHQLFRNRGNDNHWLKLNLIGTNSNRDAYGARAFVTAGGVTQVRHKTGGMRNGVQDSQMLHFGLARNREIEAIIVQWPNGRIEHFENSGVDRKYELREGSSGRLDADARIALMLPRLKDKAGRTQTFTALLGPTIDRSTLRWRVADAPDCEALSVCRQVFKRPGTFDIEVSALTKERERVEARRTLVVE